MRPWRGPRALFVGDGTSVVGRWSIIPEDAKIPTSPWTRRDSRATAYRDRGSRRLDNSKGGARIFARLGFMRKGVNSSALVTPLFMQFYTLHLERSCLCTTRGGNIVQWELLHLDNDIRKMSWGWGRGGLCGRRHVHANVGSRS
jgi:hypothetical protein